MASINGFPLVSVNESSEMETFGCEINGFSDFYNLTEDYYSNDYLLLYHCTPPDSEYWELRASTISLWTEWDSQEIDFVPRYRIVTHDGSVQIPLPIIDIDKVNMGKRITYQDFIIAISCLNSVAETNYLYFYTLSIQDNYAYF